MYLEFQSNLFESLSNYSSTNTSGVSGVGSEYN